MLADNPRKPTGEVRGDVDSIDINESLPCD